MNICIKSLHGWLQNYPRTTEWLWFIGLWFGGLLTVAALTYPIKILIKLMQP